MSLVITRQDDTPVGSIDLTVERGLDSALIDLKILNDGEEDVEGAFLTLYAENVDGSGNYFSSGHPVTAERMGRFQITGQNTDATPGQQIVTGIVQPMGHRALGLLPVVKPGDWILANFWLSQAGASAGGGSVRVKLEAANDQAAYPLDFGISQVGTGIDSGRKQPKNFYITGNDVTATGTPDDTVHVAAGGWLVIGEEYADASIEDVTFNQNDGAAAALGVGEAYLALITRGATNTPTVTKGLKAVAVDAVRPDAPVGELLLAWVTVHYSSGATVVAGGDIEDARVFGRYKVIAPATGLTVTVHPGDAVIDAFRQVKNVPEVITLAPSTVSRLWLEWNGGIVVNTSDLPPSAGAVKLASVTTDGSNVTGLADTRTYIKPIDPGSLEVKEESGGVDTPGITTLVYPDGSLTDAGGGVMHVAILALASYVAAETPAGTVNSSNTVFTLANTPAGTDQEMLFLDGVLQDRGVDYTMAGAVATFASAPTTGQKVRATYWAS